MVPSVIGVAGAGTMGAGIAQLAAAAGARALLHDPDPAALERGLAAARKRLDAGAQLEAAPRMEDFAPCGLVVEAAPESLEVKRSLFSSLAAVLAPDAVLATNTSSLSVTAIAAGVPGPERVVGMHFFNPAPLMPLLEVVAGDRSSEAALAVARATGAAMGKHVIETPDGPGFLVNRCNMPYGQEALRIVQERLATPAEVDRICRLSGGFPMGPFELMDLVGIDVRLAILESFYAQSFGEPRWQPSALVARMAAAGRHGRKTGRGWYDTYPGHRPDDPPPPEPGGGDGVVVVAGGSALADDLLDAAAAAGWHAVRPGDVEGRVPALIVDCGAGPEDPALQGGPQVLLCDSAPLAAQDPDGTAAGFYAVPGGRLVELTRGPGTSAATVSAAERVFTSLGRHVAWVGDAPGLVLGRIVCQLVNEAAFAFGEGVGSAADIDAGMRLGLRHPRGPFEWADVIGEPDVLAVVLGLHEEYREERYRPAPALMRAVRIGTALRDAI